MKILVTGFDPFGGERVNPSYEAVKLLPDMLAGAELIKLEVPTEFSRGAAVLEQALKAYRPDALLCTGQAGGRSGISVERVAINLADAATPDNAGELPVDVPLQPAGPSAYFATVPVKAIVKNIRAGGIPCALSYSAGTYVCNCLFYQALHLAATKYPSLRVGFLHVPFSEEQAAQRPGGAPCASLAVIARALEIAVKTLVCVPQDIREGMGKLC